MIMPRRGGVKACFQEAEKSLPKGTDGLFVKDQAYEIVYEECFKRIERLRSRFRPGFRGHVSVTVLYHPKSRIFIN